MNIYFIYICDTLYLNLLKLILDWVAFQVLASAVAVVPKHTFQDHFQIIIMIRFIDFAVVFTNGSVFSETSALN